MFDPKDLSLVPILPDKVVRAEDDTNSDKMMLKGTTLEINPADATISWEQLQEFFGENFPAFKSWMRGQTCTSNGPYSWDVAHYIMGNREIGD